MKKIIFLIMFLFIFSGCDKNENLEPENISLENNTGILDSTGSEVVSIDDDIIVNTHIENPEINPTETKTSFLDNLDFESDSSLTKFVNDKVSFDNLSYVPENLEYLSGDYIIDTKGGQLVREETLDALQLMSKDFYDNFGVKLSIVSAYRSYAYQKGIKDRGCSDLFCAKAGYSEHQSGLAVDFFEATSEDEFLSKPNLAKYFKWLNENAYKYGFHNSYQNGREIDGYAIEPWHWRYMGVNLATYLHDEGITFAQYYNNKKAE